MSWLEMRGPAFLLLYVCVLLGAVLAVLLLRWGLRWWLRSPGGEPDPRELERYHPYEVAYLYGGEDNAIVAAIMAMLHRGQLVLRGGEQRLHRGAPSTPGAPAGAAEAELASGGPYRGPPGPAPERGAPTSLAELLAERLERVIYTTAPVDPESRVQTSPARPVAGAGAALGQLLDGYEADVTWPEDTPVDAKVPDPTSWSPSLSELREIKARAETGRIMQRIEARLEDHGLLVRPGRRWIVWALPSLLAAAALAMGMAKCWIGLSRHRPVLFLLLLVICAVVLLVTSLVRPYRTPDETRWGLRGKDLYHTRRGERLLEGYRRRRSAQALRFADAREVALRAGLAGVFSGALVAGMALGVGAAGSWLRWIDAGLVRLRGSSSSSSTGGGGCSSWDWSDGGGGGGGGCGGGGGGGGCGGCGGCGS